MSDEQHGINPGLPADATQNIPEAPKEAQKKGLDGHDVAVAGSMIASDPPSTVMPQSEEDKLDS